MSVIQRGFYLLIIPVAVCLSGCVPGVVKDDLSSIGSSDARPLDQVGGKKVKHSDLAIGRKANLLASGDINGYGVIRHAGQLGRYLNEIEDKLVKAGGFHDFDPKVYIVAQLYPMALSDADQQIFLTTGLLQRLHNEDQLAFVLGHETAHIVFDDFSSDQYKNFLSKSAGLVKAMSFLNLGGKQVMPESVVRKVSWSSRIGSVLMPQWTKTQERRADRMSVDLLAKEGYSLDSAIEASGILVSMSRATKARVAKQHKELEAEMHAAIKGAATNGSVGGVIKTGFKAALSSLKNIGDKLHNSHGDASARVQSLEQYIHTEYPYDKYPWQAPKLARFKAELNSRNVKNMFLVLHRLNSADYNASQGKKSLARKDLNRAARLRSNLDSDIVITMRAQALNTLGYHDSARSMLEKLVSHHSHVYRSYTELASIENASGNYQGAARDYLAALKVFGKQNGPLYIDAIRNYRLANKPKQAESLVLLCSKNAPASASICANAAGIGHSKTLVGVVKGKALGNVFGQ